MIRLKVTPQQSAAQKIYSLTLGKCWPLDYSGWNEKAFVREEC